MSKRTPEESKKSKEFEAAIRDLPNLVDALFVGNPDVPGWVSMNVSPKGRECVDALFPQAQIAWRKSDFPTDPSGDWGDWRGFEINLPDVVAQTETKLPLEITGGADLDEAQPDALALLLAIAVKRQGGRSAYFARGCMEIFHPDNQQ